MMDANEMTTFRLVAPLLGILLLAGCVGSDISPSTSFAKPDRIVLGPRDLYLGFEARKVLPNLANGCVTLDARVFKFGKEREGVITTDVIDLGAYSGLIGQQTDVKSVQLEVAADAPIGTAIQVEARTGNNALDQQRWSPWRKLPGLKGPVADPQGRYIQVRLTLSASAPDRLPTVSSLTLIPDSVIPDGIVPGAPAPRWQRIRILQADILPIVRSPIGFQYEKFNHPKLAKFRQAAGLDAVVKGAKTDFETIEKLMDWVGSCANPRDVKKYETNGVYAWDIDKVFEVKDGKPHIYGHCMSYAEVLVTAATAMGFVASRHMCMVGFRESSHEIAEIWVPSLNKWVYFDPSLTNWYYDKSTGQPMNLLEMHNLVAAKFLPPGKDMHWWSERAQDRNAPQKQRVREVGGKAHIGSRLGPWNYGKPMPADYDWGWLHGYLAAGFFQMTPRNDFHSHPEATPRQFGHNPGYNGHPFWVDPVTPPTEGGHNWFTRPRDFYWTVDQASIRLVRNASGGTIFVELGNTMPNFQQYQLKIDDVEVPRVTNPHEWILKAGVNKLEVTPIDQTGRRGQGSSVMLDCYR